MAFPVSGKEMFSKNLYADNYQAFEAVYGMKQKSASKDENNKPEMVDNLFKNMRGFLIFGRLVGVIPVSGVFSSNHKALYFRKLGLPVIISLVITALVGLSTILAILETIEFPKFNALQIARSIQGTIFKVWGLFGYVYFLYRANSFVNIFKCWGTSSLFYNVKDKSLQRDIIILSAIIFIAAIAESTLIHLEYFPQFDNISGQQGNDTLTRSTTLETYYLRSHGHWRRILGYHPILAIIAFISHKELCLVALDNLHTYQNTLGIKVFGMSDRLIWIHIVKDHETLCTLLEAFEKFLSPLIFGSYATNIYYICMQLIDGLTPEKVDHSLVHSIFAPVSFLFLILRAFLLSVSAARINTYAHEIGNILKKCPIELYEAEVERVDKHVTAGPDIGLSGIGCFVITKPFMLSILNVIFTVEIVLLQGLSSGDSCSKPSPSSQ